MSEPAERSSVSEEPTLRMPEAEGPKDAAEAGLYAAHDIKNELELDPEVLQLPSGSAMPGPILNNTIVKVEQFALRDCSVLIKVERLDETHHCSACNRTFNHESILESHKCREDMAARETDSDVSEIGLENETENLVNTNVPAVCLETQARADINTATVGTAGYKMGSKQKYDCSGLTRLLLRDCYVSIEPLNLERTRHHNQENPIDLDKESSIEEDNNRVDSEYEQYTCDYCGKRYAVKSRLIKHILWHIHKLADDRDDTYSMENGVVLNGTSRSGDKTHKNVIIDNKASHTREKSNLCKTCGLTFAQNGFKTHECIKPVNINHSKEVSKHRYPCHICKRTFSQSSYLNKHKQLCNMYSCDVCGKEVSNKDFEMHKKYHSADALYTCEICEKAFKCLKSLKYHLKIHIGKKSFQCEICDQRFVCFTNLRSHKQIHRRDKQYHCDSCGRKFSHLSALKYHVIIHGADQTYELLKRYIRPPGPPNVQHLCKFCDKEFTCASLLNYHERLHTGEKPYTCEICKKTFRIRINLTRHHKRNHEVKDTSKLSRKLSKVRDKYTCSICKKELFSEVSLNAHEKLHTGERPFVCECEKSYGRKTSLYKHRMSHKKGFPCKICHKIFTQSQSLSRHMIIHSEGMQTCTICGKEVLKSSFKNHERYHSDDMYSCEICERGYKRLDNLKQHLQIHTGKKLFTCDYCSKRFSQKSSLVRHVRSHHVVKNS